MRRKARDILRDQQGLSMILVLCIGALFVALSAGTGVRGVRVDGQR